MSLHRSVQVSFPSGRHYRNSPTRVVFKLPNLGASVNTKVFYYRVGTDRSSIPRFPEIIFQCPFVG